jgi:hypothetical protein
MALERDRPADGTDEQAAIALGLGVLLAAQRQALPDALRHPA